MNFAVVGINKMTESQLKLRESVDESRIRTIKASEVLNDLIMVKKNPLPKGSRITGRHTWY